MTKAMNVFSFSRLSLFKTCPRKFYLKYVLGMEEPPSEPAELGKAVHRYIELTLRGEDAPLATAMSEVAQGIVLDASEVEKLASAYLKKHQNLPLQRYEGHLTFEIGSHGTVFQGYVDMIDESGQVPMITDFKSGRNFYDPNETMQLRLYAWLLHKKYGYENIDARLWFLRDKVKSAVRLASYTVSDFQDAEQWATDLIEEIYARLQSINLGLETEIEAFPPTHGHSCTHCPFAIHCRPDLLTMPEAIETEEDALSVAEKVLVLERILELQKARLKEFSLNHGSIRVADEEFKLKPLTIWSYPVIPTSEILKEFLQEGQTPEDFLKVDTTSLKKVFKEHAELEERLKSIGTSRQQFNFVHQKAGDEDAS